MRFLFLLLFLGASAYAQTTEIQRLPFKTIYSGSFLAQEQETGYSRAFDIASVDLSVPVIIEAYTTGSVDTADVNLYGSIAHELEGPWVDHATPFMDSASTTLATDTLNFINGVMPSRWHNAVWMRIKGNGQTGNDTLVTVHFRVSFKTQGEVGRVQR